VPLGYKAQERTPPANYPVAKRQGKRGGEWKKIWWWEQSTKTPGLQPFWSLLREP